MPASTSAADGIARGTIVIEPAETAGLASLVAQTIDDARALASAEIELQKAKLGERVAAYRGAIIMFAVAGVLGLCGFIALLVGLILALATVSGPGLATAAVVLTVMVTATVLAMIGRARLAPPKWGKRAS